MIGIWIGVSIVCSVFIIYWTFRFPVIMLDIARFRGAENLKDRMMFTLVWVFVLWAFSPIIILLI